MNNNDFSIVQLKEILFNQMALDNKAPFLLALSGGVDSTVLLHAMAQLQQQHAIKLTALHVNHKLQPQSDQWQQHCIGLCKQLNVPFMTISIDVPKLLNDKENSGQGIEAVARLARYNWFFQQLAEYNTGYLLTAHHQQDRAETVLFNLLRGAGSNGLSSMPAMRQFHNGQLVRPLLGYTRQHLTDYAHQHGLTWVEDPSNQKTQFSRNYIRHKIIPILTEFRHDAINNIVRSADNLQSESQVLQEVAEQDLTTVSVQAYNPLDRSMALSVDDLNKFSVARTTNLLRFWFAQKQLPIHSQQFMQSLLLMLRQPSSGTAILQHNGYQFRCYEGYLYVMRELMQSKPITALVWQDITTPQSLPTLNIELCAKRSLIKLLAHYDQAHIVIKNRQPGERMKDIEGNNINLKQWMSQQKIPPWRRFIAPLLTLVDQQQTYFLAVLDKADTTPLCDVNIL